MNMSQGAGTHARFMGSRFFPSINGLRALSAIFVIKEHTQWRLPLPQLFEWGFLGVDLFFVISGFLIVTLLLRERDGTGNIDLKSFYVRRTLRIFPVYYLVIFLLMAVAGLTYAHSPKSWDLYKWSFPIFLLYAQNIIPVSLGLMFHTWSLAMEEQFYLCWPVIEKCLRPIIVVPLLLLLLALNQAVNFGFFNSYLVDLYNDKGAPLRPTFAITFTPILLGVLAAHAMNFKPTGEKLSAVLDGYWTPVFLLGAAATVCEVAPVLQGWGRATVHVLFCLLLLSLVVNPVNAFSRFLNWRPLSYLGTISYGFYLYHVFVIACLIKVSDVLKFPLHTWALFLTGTMISIGIAALSFKYFERPIMALRQQPAGDRAANRQTPSLAG